MRRIWRVIGIGLAGVGALGGCGDDDGTTGAGGSSTSTSDATATTTSAPVEDEADVGGRDDFTPGSISYRFVHVAPEFGEIDVYARTGQGLVEEYLLEEDVAFGSVLEDLRPPAEGGLLVVPTGTTDLNPHTNDDVVADLSVVNAADQGPQHTLVLHPEHDGDDGVQVTDYWEAPEAGLLGTHANALPPAVPGQGLVVIANDSEADSVFVARPGGGACLEPEPPTTPNTAIGGTVVQSFATTPGPTELAFHSFDDQDFDCTGPRVLTASVDAPADGRVFVLLHDDGAGDLAAMTFPLP